MRSGVSMVSVILIFVLSVFVVPHWTQMVRRARVSYDGCSGLIGLAEGRKLHRIDLSIG